MMAGYTSNKFGRKRTIQIGSAIAVIGCSLQTGAVNLGMLMAGRFIAGLAIGCLSMIVPLYQSYVLPALAPRDLCLSVVCTSSELSPPKFRGQLSGMTQLLISFGFCELILGPINTVRGIDLSNAMQSLPTVSIGGSKARSVTDGI